MTNNDNYLMLNGKKIELTEEEIRKLGLKHNKGIFDRVCYPDYFYGINEAGRVIAWTETDNDYFDGFYLAANYCTDKETMTKRAKEEVLNRLLWRFSMENGWNDKLWKDYCYKYYIITSGKTGNHCVGRTSGLGLEKETQTIYFVSAEIAQRAIDEILIPFEKGELEVCEIWEE